MFTDAVITSGSKLLLDVARPVLRHLPRGAGTLYRWLGGNRRTISWSKYGCRGTRGIDHGYGMRLELDNAFERETFYLGRFYEWELQCVLNEFVGQGDTVIDVGANIGMITLCAAARVGAQGRVLAFEPNPEARNRLSEHVRINQLRHVQVIPAALGEVPGTATLTTATAHTGTGTLRPSNGAALSHTVEVRRLDDFLDQLPSAGGAFLKIDTEGYDFSVLKGARQLLSRPDVTVFAEVNDRWLKELGQSAEEMFAYMSALGYKPFYPRLETSGLKRRVRLEPLTLPGPHHWFNALFRREPNL